jgi:pimeloyl-ACP methyl ester carboxylesterase
MAAIHHRRVPVNGVTVHVAEAGKGAPIVLLHGVPELWYSWRHQIPALAEAGYRVLAPDLRGCGGSDAPGEVASDSMVHLIGDVVGLLDAVGVRSAVLAGHDWGAQVAWQCAKAHPDRVSVVAALSVPYTPRPAQPPSVLAERFSRDAFSFVRYFQQPGLAEAELERDPHRFFRLFFYGLSGDAPPELVRTLYLGKPRGARLLDGIPEPPGPLPWLTEADLDYFATEYARAGFTGALNRYRNLDRDWAELASLDGVTVQQPVLFIGGAHDSAVLFGDLEPTRSLPQLDKLVLLPGCGHWVQQERAAEVTAELVAFLARHPTNSNSDPTVNAGELVTQRRDAS